MDKPRSRSPHRRRPNQPPHSHRPSGQSEGTPRATPTTSILDTHPTPRPTQAPNLNPLPSHSRSSRTHSLLCSKSTLRPKAPTTSSTSPRLPVSKWPLPKPRPPLPKSRPSLPLRPRPPLPPPPSHPTSLPPLIYVGTRPTAQTHPPPTTRTPLHTPISSPSTRTHQVRPQVQPPPAAKPRPAMDEWTHVSLYNSSRKRLPPHQTVIALDAHGRERPRWAHRYPRREPHQYSTTRLRELYDLAFPKVPPLYLGALPYIRPPAPKAKANNSLYLNLFNWTYVGTHKI